MSDPNSPAFQDWDRFKQKMIDEKDILHLSFLLKDHSALPNDLMQCLGLSNDDELNLDDSTQKALHLLLIKWWHGKNLKVKWDSLLSCLSDLNNSDQLQEKIYEEIYKAVCDSSKVTAEKYGTIILPHQERGYRHEFSQCVYTSVPINIFDDPEFGDCVTVERSNDPVMQQSICLYKKLVANMVTADRVNPDTDRIKSVKIEMWDLQKRFASLLRKTYVALHHRDEPVHGLRVFLNQLSCDEKEEVRLFGKRISELISHTSLEQTFLLFSQIGVWDFLNYHIVEALVDEYKIETLSESFSSYKEVIDKFMNNTALADFLAVWGGRTEIESNPDYVPVIAKLEEKWGTYTLAGVASLQKDLAQGFRLKSIVFRFANASPGSVYIMWLVPVTAASHMQQLMDSLQRPNLTELKVTELVIGNRLNKVYAHLYEGLYEESVERPKFFWGKMAQLLQWQKPFEEVLREDGKHFSWFKGGLLNVSENCLDRHVDSDPNKVALIVETDSGEVRNITYKKLLQTTCRLANVLKTKNIKKGDRVVIYMPNTHITIAAMLGCARIGAVYCVVNPVYGVETLTERLCETKANTVITVDETINGMKPKANVDKSIEEKTVKVTNVLLVKCNSKTTMNECDTDLLEEMDQQSSECPPEPMCSDDPLFYVYTSGSARPEPGTDRVKPRAVIHTQAGFLLSTAVNHKLMFDCEQEDIHACMAGLGWLAGQIFTVYGPLCDGGTSVVMNCTPCYKDVRDWCLQLIEKLQTMKVTHFYTVPACYKLLSQLGEQQLQDFDLSSLKVIGTAGEPIPSDVEEWCYETLGRQKCLFLDIYGLTELGRVAYIRYKPPSNGHSPSLYPENKWSFPLFGTKPHIVKESSDVAKGEGPWELFLNWSHPGMAREVIIGGKQQLMVDTELYNSTEYFSTKDGITPRRLRPDGLLDKCIVGRLSDVWEVEGTSYWGITQIESLLKKRMDKSSDIVQEAQVVPNRDTKSATVFVQTPNPESLQNEQKSSVICELQLVLKELLRLPLQHAIFTKSIPKPISGKRATAALAKVANYLMDMRETVFQGIPVVVVSPKMMGDTLENLKLKDTLTLITCQ